MFPDYKKHEEELLRFILDYRDVQGVKGLYVEKVRRLRSQGSRVFEVELDHVAKFTQGSDLVSHIVTNTKMYVRILASILESLINKLNAKSRCPKLSQAHVITADKGAATHYFREIYLLPPCSLTCRTVRSLRAPDIGSLVKVQGVVTRASDVTPSAQELSYVCDVCGKVTWQSVRTQLEFAPLISCPYCSMNRVTGRLQAICSGSNFVKYQELRLQELPDQVPTGHIPYSVVVQCHGKLTRKCVPGTPQR